MKPLIEEKLIAFLVEGIKLSKLPAGTYTDKEINAWETERGFLLEQLRRLESEDAWWAAEEWEWFINRCLDHLGVE